jgi:ribonuclease D
VTESASPASSAEPSQADETAQIDEVDEVELLLEPRDGLPPVVEDADALAAAAERLGAGTGPVAIDAERASGYRYGQRAYLVQLRRAGSGTVLVDPIACPELGPLAAVLKEPEWVLHAASQDLACLAEIGLEPASLFDTELAGRLLGYPRVALGTLVEEVLGFRLEKGHAAVDWSTRPLPTDWIRYAALDVELLVELRDALDAQLSATGKREWAAQEFAALVAAPPNPPREDPWRRTSGMHRVHKPRQLAIVRELWETRDRIAERRDIAPGRILPDAAIVEAALAVPTTVDELGAVQGFGGRATKRHVATWFKAVEAALAARRLPSLTRPGTGPPPPRSWAARDAAAAARLAAAREAVLAIAGKHQLPAENLIAPDVVRRLTWEPPAVIDETTVAAALVSSGARPWQVELTTPALTAALLADPPLPRPETPT